MIRHCLGWSNKQPLMKIHALILSMFIGASTALGVVALPPATGTNIFAALQASQIHDREIAQRYYDTGQIVQLQRQTDRLEVEVVALAVGVGAVGAALILLLSRERIRETSRVQENPAKESNTSK
jgi:hypothetical protein